MMIVVGHPVILIALPIHFVAHDRPVICHFHQEQRQRRRGETLHIPAITSARRD
jgi:hypothetical protein